MKVVLYEDKYYDDLYVLLKMFQNETYNVDKDIRVDDFIKYHNSIYLIVDGSNIVGFSSYFINDNYGLDEMNIFNDYLYVVPSHRGTKATYLLMLQTGAVVTDNNLPLSHAYASEGSDRLGKRLSGKKMFTAYRYTVEEVEREFNKLKKLVKLKER